MRWLKYLAGTIVALFIAVPTLLYVLVATQAGSNWLIATGLDWAKLNVHYQEFEGRLLDGFTFHQLSYNAEGMLVDADRVTVQWQPWALLDRQLDVEVLYIQNISIATEPTAEAPTKENVRLPDVELPFSVAINELEITDINWQQPGAEQFQLPITLRSQLDWQAQELHLRQLTVKTRQANTDITFDGDLSVTTAADYPLSLAGAYAMQVQDSTIDLSTIEGELDLTGALGQQLKLTATMNAVEMSEQYLEATVNSPLANPEWQALVRLNQLKLQPFLGLIPNENVELEELTNAISERTTASGELNVDAIMLTAQNVTVKNIGQRDGELVVDGSWRHESLQGPLQESNFELQVRARDLLYQQDNNEVNLRTLEANTSGTLDDYSFDLVSMLVLSYQLDNQAQVDSVQVSVTGVGDQRQAQIDRLELQGSHLTAQASGALQWAPTFSMNLKVDSAQAQTTLNGEQAIIALDGGLALTESSLSFAKFHLSVPGLKIEINGSTANQQQITGLIQIDEVQRLPGVPEAARELQKLTSEFQLSANTKLSQFSLELARLDIATESFSELRLTAPSTFEFTRDAATWRLASNDLCLTDERQRFGEFCTKVTADPEQFVVNTKGRQMSLWLLNRLRADDVAERIAGNVDLQGKVILGTSSLKIRDLDLKITSEDTVFFALDQETSTRLAYWEVTAQGDASAITATLDGQLAEDQGGIIGDFSILNLGNEDALDGFLLFTLDDLAMLDWVFPGMRYEGGKATASLEIGGSLAQPTLAGDMEIYAETVGFAQTNLVFNEVRLALIDSPATEGELEIRGQARSGSDGALFIEGVAIPLEEEAYISIEGQNFRALQMPTATVDISPDLTIYLKDKLIDIAGTVDVPYAQITSPEFETSQSRSADVIVTQNGEPVSNETNTIGDIQVQAAIRVNLGEQVLVDAYGFEGRLTGSLELVEQPRRPVTAVGSINVAKGSYTLYGQELVIDRGSFIYNGGDISNPGLNLRVQKSVNDATSASKVNVGAQVGGTLIEPDFRLFSSPAMPDSEILSYLILGRSMQSASSTGSEDLQLQALLMLGAQGTEAIGETLQNSFGIDEVGLDTDPSTRQTSFYIGKYLSPKLYIKYGVGLLESTNTFMVRYQLTERLLLETMTSTQAQGGDIFYTFER